MNENNQEKLARQLAYFSHQVAERQKGNVTKFQRGSVSQRVSTALPMWEQTKPGVANVCFCGKGISFCLSLFLSLSLPPSLP